VRYRLSFASVMFVFVSVSQCQQTSRLDPTQPSVSQSENQDARSLESKRILGIIPNYRTSPSLQHYEPLITSEKFKIASEDAFDRGTVGLAALFGVEGQLTNANRSFGQGVKGYGRYLGTAYGDLVIGDYMTEAVFPSFYIKTRATSDGGREADGPDSPTQWGKFSGPIETQAELSLTTRN
jgi:hypothetical protein